MDTQGTLDVPDAGIKRLDLVMVSMHRVTFPRDTTPEQRTVPLYIFSPKVLPGRFEDKEISQLNTAPLLCRLLDIKPAPGMRQSIEVATKPDEKVNAYD